jgi:hypothetical protein
MKSWYESAQLEMQTAQMLDKELEALKQVLDAASREWLLMLAVSVMEVLEEKHGIKVRA